MTTTEAQSGMSESDILRAEIEAWTMVLRNAQGTLLLARRELEKRGVKLKPAEFVQIIDISIQTVVL